MHWLFLSKIKKRITITNAFQKFLDESKPKPIQIESKPIFFLT